MHVIVRIFGDILPKCHAAGKTECFQIFSSALPACDRFLAFECGRIGRCELILRVFPRGVPEHH